VRVVILGTGTDVGKTYVTASIARGLRRHGTVLALKPIESGVEGGRAGDAGAIAEAAGHPPALSRWRFARGVSPHLAAREAGVVIEVGEVAKWLVDQEMHAQGATTLVELAGGAFSPLALGVTNVELALALEPAVWLLVAPDSLGVLHDLTATLRALPRAPDAIVLSAARAADASSGSNAVELAQLGIAGVVEVVRRDAGGCPETVAWLRDRQTYKSGGE
jgi:dethiobiotin synthetase